MNQLLRTKMTLSTKAKLYLVQCLV